MFVCEKSKIIIDFVLVIAVFTQFLSFLGFVKVFCFGKIRKCIFLMFFFGRTSGNPISEKLRELGIYNKTEYIFLSFFFCGAH